MSPDRCTVTFVCTPELRDKISRVALKHGLSVSAYIRGVCGFMASFYEDVESGELEKIINEHRTD